MGRQRGMLWALAGLWAWLLCGRTAAVPVPTDWVEDDTGDFTSTSDGLSWGTVSDYFDPTVLLTTEEPTAFMEEIQATEYYTPSPLLGKSEENLGSVSSANSSRSVEEGTSGSGSTSTPVGNVASSTDGPKNPGTTPSGENAKETTEGHVSEKTVFLTKTNSSLEKETTQTAVVVSKEEASGSSAERPAETAATLPDEQPGATELLAEKYPSATDASLPSATSSEGIWASPFEEEANSVASSELSFLPPAAGGQEALDAAMNGSNVSAQLNPTVAPWEETPGIVPEPDEETPDAGREAAALSSSPEADPSSHTEELPLEEAGAAPADGSSPAPPPEGDVATPSLELPPPGLLPSSNASAQSSEPGELLAASVQPPPAGEAALSAESVPGEGRGDADSSVSAGVPESDMEATAILSSTGPEVGPENTADVPTVESEDLLSAELSGSPPVDESTLDSPPNVASPRDSPSGPSDLDSDATAASPIGLPLGSGSASQLPEDSEIQDASSTNEEAEEGSGSPDSNKEVAFASSSPEQAPGSSGTDVPAGEEVSADLDSGTASPLNPSSENEQPPVSTESETSSDMTAINSAGEAEKVPGALPDTKTSPPSLLEDETAAEAQGASQKEEASPSATPGKIGSSPEGSEATAESDVAPESATNDAAAETSSEGQNEVDSRFSSMELVPPVGRSEILDDESSRLSPAEDIPVPVPSGGQPSFPSTSSDESLSAPSDLESDATETPSNEPPGSLASSHPPPDNGMGAGSEATTGPEELGHSAVVNGEETSLSPVVSSTEPELAPAVTAVTEDGGDTSETVGEGSLSDGSSSPDEVNTLSPEPQLGPGDVAEASPPSSAEATDAEPGGLSPLPVDAGKSTDAQESSEKGPSSASSSGSSSSENKDGEASPSPASDTPLGPSSQGTNAAEVSRDGEGSMGFVANEGAGATSSEDQAGTDLPLSGAEIGPTERSELPGGTPGSDADGEIPRQPPVDDGETLAGDTASGEESPSASVSPGEKSSPSVVFEPPGAEPSGSNNSPGSYQLSPDVALKPGSTASEEDQELEDTFSVEGKDLVPVDPGPPSASPSNEKIEGPGSDLAGSEESQLSPEDAATTEEGVEPYEGFSSASGKETYLAPSASESQVSSSSSPEEVESDGSSPADSEESTLPPDDAVRAGSGEESEDTPAAGGKEPSLSPLVTELQSAAASTKEVETAISESEAIAGSQPPADAAGPGSSKEQWESSSAASEQETPLGSSVGESPETSADEEVSEGLGEGRPLLSTEWVDPASSELTSTKGSQPLLANAGGSNGKELSVVPLAAEPQPDSLSTEMANMGSATNTGSQPSVDSGATAGAAASEEGEESTISEKKSSLAPTSTELQSPGTGEDVSGGLVSGESPLLPEGEETPLLESAAKTGSQSSPDSAATGDGVAAEEQGESEDISPVRGKEPSLDASSTESQSSGTSASKEVSGGLDDEESSLPIEEVEAASSESATSKGSQPSLDDAATGVSNGKEPPLSPLAAESPSDSLSTEGLETPSLGSTTNTGSQPSLDSAGTAGGVPSEEGGESILSEKKSSLAPLSPDSPSSGTSTSEDVSGGLVSGESPLFPEGVETPILESATKTGSQSSPDGAATAEDATSEEQGESEDVSIVSGKEPSLDALSTASQSSGTAASKEASGGLDDEESSLPTEGVETASSESATSKESQPSLDDAATGVSKGKEPPLAPLAAESPSDSLSTEGLETPSLGTATNAGSQPSLNNALSTSSQSSGISASTEVSGGHSDEESFFPTEGLETPSLGTATNTGSQPSLNNALSTSSQSSGISASTEVSGGHSDEESFFPTEGLETPSLGTATNAGSQPSADSAATAGAVVSKEGMSGKEASLGALSTESQSSGTSTSEDVSGGRGDGDSSLPTEGVGMASLGSTATKGSTSSTEIVQSPEHVAEQLGEKSGSTTGAESFPQPSSVDGSVATIHKASGGTLPSASAYSDEILATKTGANQVSTDSSQPPPENGDAGDNMASLGNTGSAEKSGSGQPLPSSSDLLGGSDSGPAIKGGMPPQPSKSEAAGTAERVSLGKPPTKAASPAASGVLSPSSEQSQVAVSVSKGKSGKSKAPSSPGKPPNSALAKSSGSSSASKPTKSGSPIRSGNSSLSPSSTLSKPAVGVSKVASANGKGKPETRLAASGAAKSSKSTSKTSEKKPDSSSRNSKDGKAATAKGKSGRVPAVPVPTSSPVVSLFPYGASANDKEYVERKVDFNSPVFKPEIGVPLGKTLRDFLYFTDNGQIIFPASDKDISSYPNPPPKGFNGREKVPMVAVFWDNADFSRGSGTTFYQEYVTQTSAKHPVVRDVEAKIQQYLKSSYSAVWTLKITWVKAQPYPAQRHNSRTNTYQAILTTDGTRTYTLFLYQNGGMQWDYRIIDPANVLIGWTSGDGYFKNDDLMTKTTADKYRPDQNEGYNTGVRGLWVYKLDSRIRVNYRQRCLDWVAHEGRPSAWNKNLPPCPCSLQQGLSDYRFVRSSKGVLDSRLTMLYSSAPNKYGAGVRCLYNRNNQLVEGHQERVWKASRKSSPNNDDELKFYDWCCNQTGSRLFCDKYSQKRPKIGCDGYRPPVRAAASSEEEDSKSEEGRD